MTPTARCASASRLMLFAACAATAAPHAGAASPSVALEEVIVTAVLRRDGLDSLPASVTYLDERALHERGATHLQDVLQAVPNLNWASGTSRPRYFQLRGIGETEQWQGAPNPSVGLLIDGMDFSGVGGIATLSDVARVDVLRGPQATALGANALAGLISIRTRAPSAEPEARVELGAGDYGAGSAAGTFGGGLGDAAAWRTSVRVDRADGFTRNVHLDRRDTNDFDERSARAGLAWRPREALSLRLSTLWADYDNGYDAFAIDNSRSTLADKPGRDAQQSRGASLSVNWAATGRLELQSLTAWTDSDIDYGYDGDWGFDPDYDFTQLFVRSHRMLSQDLRLVSAAPGRGEPGLGWILGVYGLELTEANEQTDRFAGELLREPLASDYRAAHLALYGQGEWQIDDDWRATLGLRGERRSATYRDSDGADYDPTDRMLGGQLSIERRLGVRSTGYLTLARGYKAGGFNIGAQVPESRRAYDPETLDSAELGLRIGLADGKVGAQLAIFSMRRRDQQVSTSLQLDPGDPLSFIFLTDNAADGRNDGLEATVSWQAGPRMRLESALGLLRTRYVGYRVGDRSLDGREQAHAPEYQLDLAAQYDDPRGWFARAELHAVDDFYFSDTHDQRSGAYATLDVRVGFERERWGVSLWVRNALDAGYTQRGFFFGNEPPDFPDKLYVQPGDPRRIGASAWLALL